MGRDGILVNAIGPGYIKTELNTEFLESHPVSASRSVLPWAVLVKPEDLDGALLLLAGPAGAYITGTVIAVDGGLTLSTL